MPRSHPKTLLFGASGRLGTVLRRNDPQVIGLSRSDCDITDQKSVLRAVEQHQPDWIINCAAITDVEACEGNRKGCWRVNVDAVGFLVTAAAQGKSKLIQISSNYAVNPVNIYGESKLAAELLIPQSGLILRTDLYDHKTYIVQTLLEKDAPLNAYGDKFFNPISMASLADWIFDMPDATGIKNLGTNKRISMAEFALQICDTFDIPKERVREVPSQDLPGQAARPKDLWLKPDNDLSIEADLLRFKNELKKQKNTDCQPTPR